MNRGRGSSKGGGDFEGRKILLIVTGGISAYKSAFLVRLFRRRGADVRVLMTDAATKFVTPLTFEVLSDNPVPLDMFARRDKPGVEHVELARWPDTIVVAPATADFMGKIALGLADDLPSCVICAAGCPVWLAPAMNDGMWENPAVRRNVDILINDGRNIIPPETGELACASSGPGRMASPERIVDSLGESSLARGLAGIRILVTAGRTEEALDPVRYITNRSTGRMGFELARTAKEMGGTVTLIHGAVDLDPPHADRVIRVTTAREMKRAVLKHFPSCDLLLMAAAVSDYKPARKSAAKIKRGGGPIKMELVPTTDILSSLETLKREDQIVAGFALEDSDGEKNAKKKGRKKKCDYIVLNMIGKDTGFGGDTNRITVFKGSRKVAESPLVSKREAARILLGTILKDKRIRETAG
jgi:phosphopantothenoylcysteine decarboxylase/phosphopantothenate--cysteine ligase